MDSTSLSIILGVFVVLSAFFSAAETSYTSLNRIKIKMEADEGNKKAKKALLIFDNFDITITTILVCNNVVNIGAATIGTLLTIDLFPSLKQDYVALVSTFSVTLIILLLGEVLPKNYAKTHSEKFALLISSILLLVIKLLKPLSYPIIAFNKFVGKTYLNDNDKKSVTEDEIKAYIESVELEGILEEEEGELVRSVLDFDETTIGDILTPRTDIIGVSTFTTEKELLDLIYSEKFSRLPLYEESLDDIIGLIYERDVLIKIAKGKKINLKQMMREVHFVPKSMKASSLLKYLQEHSAHMAIVIDEHGGTCGLITMEDLLEEIVGDIYDETDIVVEKVVKKDGYYLVSQDETVEDFFDSYLDGETYPETEYANISGWVYELLEILPYEGAEVSYDGDKFLLKMTVFKVESNRIEQVKVEVEEKKLENSELVIKI